MPDTYAFTARDLECVLNELEGHIEVLEDDGEDTAAHDHMVNALSKLAAAFPNDASEVVLVRAQFTPAEWAALEAAEENYQDLKDDAQ